MLLEGTAGVVHDEKAPAEPLPPPS
jgi:hypothetical protein